jgi:hypothetical protein
LCFEFFVYNFGKRMYLGCVLNFLLIILKEKKVSNFSLKSEFFVEPVVI